MKLSEEAIKEFKELYFQASGQKLTTPEAIELGMRLINLLKAVYGTDISWLKKLNLRQKNAIIQWYSTEPIAIFNGCLWQSEQSG